MPITQAANSKRTAAGNKRWILVNKLNSKQHLGLGHRGSCCYAPGSVCVCMAAASPRGCTCGCDRSDDLRGSRWKCFCWSALQLLHQPQRATLRRQTAVTIITSAFRVTVSPAFNWFLFSSYHLSLSELILQRAHIFFLRESKTTRRNR